MRQRAIEGEPSRQRVVRDQRVVDGAADAGEYHHAGAVYNEKQADEVQES